jgi:hypothetical protein
MVIAAVSPVMKGPYADSRRARRNNPPVESSKRKIMIGRNHCEPMTGPIPRVLISTNQQSGHFGIAAARIVVMTGNPTALELGPMVDALSTLLLTETPVRIMRAQVPLVTKLASQQTAQ